MNEISNFCNDGSGQVCKGKSGCPTGKVETQTDCCLECSTVDATNPLDFPPYQIHNKQVRYHPPHSLITLKAKYLTLSYFTPPLHHTTPHHTHHRVTASSAITQWP